MQDPKLEDFDEYYSLFPRPIRALMRCFKQECNFAIRSMILRLGLVSKQEYQVTQDLLIQAQEKIKKLEEQLS
ncbi:hypothetical protein MMH89_00380 [Candidatus Comchoanobacter bicostacola]|uniref:Uncharacterized protein n=1 Tax=Candidatus Comchoanobacter bicostacola TaxID=2919598 RepID=A0ABY5DLG8_9GAMM|nr:hypothetical protein [Candidatus Comchoanobacter bicostacola]UTC24622.1 hypothetical protein MMH89_00380 [Candidatus Comchoanobacter bicostacola]